MRNAVLPFIVLAALATSSFGQVFGLDTANSGFVKDTPSVTLAASPEVSFATLENAYGIFSFDPGVPPTAVLPANLAVRITADPNVAGFVPPYNMRLALFDAGLALTTANLPNFGDDLSVHANVTLLPGLIPDTSFSLANGSEALIDISAFATEFLAAWSGSDLFVLLLLPVEADGVTVGGLTSNTADITFNGATIEVPETETATALAALLVLLGVYRRRRPVA